MDDMQTSDWAAARAAWAERERAWDRACDAARRVVALASGCLTGRLLTDDDEAIFPFGTASEIVAGAMDLSSRADPRYWVESEYAGIRYWLHVGYDAWVVELSSDEFAWGAIDGRGMTGVSDSLLDALYEAVIFC